MENRISKITDPSVIVPADNCDDLFLQLFNSMYDGICLFEMCGSKIRALYLNERFFETVGYTKEQYLPYYENVTVPLFDEDEARVFDHLKKCIEEGKDIWCDVRGFRYDGSVSWYCIRARTVDFIKSDNPVFIASINDITDKKDIEWELAVNKTWNRIVSETVDTYLFELDYILDKMTFLPGQNAEPVVIENYTGYLRSSGRICDDDVMYYANSIYKACRKKCNGHIDVRTFNNQKNDYDICRVHYSSITDDYDFVIRVAGRLELIGRNDEIELRAETDRRINGELGLPDSRTAIEEIKKKITDSRKKYIAAVADIDNLGECNEKFGREAGDKAVIAAAKIIKNIYGDNAIVFRYVGDEFFIFMEDISENEFYGMFEELRASCGSVVIDGIEGSGFTVSMGAAWTSRDEKVKVTDFFITVDNALSMAKIEGKDRLDIKKIIY